VRWKCVCVGGGSCISRVGGRGKGGGDARVCWGGTDNGTPAALARLICVRLVDQHRMSRV
jgi:hypothetical protein